MTKKHFIALAGVIRGLRPTEPSDDTEWVVYRDALADFCKAQNPRFDRAQWIGYVMGECGPSGGKR